MSETTRQATGTIGLQATDLTVTRSGNKILQHIESLAIGDGLTVVMGPSGSGKSTLANTMYGLEPPTTGRVVHVRGEEVVWESVPPKRSGWLQRIIQYLPIETPAERRASAHRRTALGYIPQEPYIPDGLVASGFVGTVRSALGSYLDDAWVDTILSGLNVTDHIGKTTNELSGGEAQRFVIAFALAHRPEFVVADEPTSALDSSSGQRTMEFFRSITRKCLDGPMTSMLLVTHDPRSVEYADRVITLRDGYVESDSLV